MPDIDIKSLVCSPLLHSEAHNYSSNAVVVQEQMIVLETLHPHFIHMGLLNINDGQVYQQSSICRPHGNAGIVCVYIVALKAEWISINSSLTYSSSHFLF